MIRPVSLYIGLRYTRAKRRNRFVSFISLVSMLGIALGVAVLITVLSVMNGFDYQIRKQFFSVAPAITVSTRQDISKIWPELSRQVSQVEGIDTVAPFVSGKGMLTNQGLVSGVEALGVIPEQEAQISSIPSKMTEGKFSSLTPGSYHMVIGKKLASSLGLMLGDKVSLFTSQTTTTPFGMLPRFRQFTVTGIFDMQSGFGFETGVAFINLKDAEKLYAPDVIGGLHLRLHNVFQAPEISDKLNSTLSSNYYISDWTQTFGTFFKSLAMEKTMMFVILLLIVAVAVFNLVATLMMTVNEKRTDIAILRTIGASPRTILTIFIIQGGLVGIVGTLIGIVSGILLALNATEIVNWLQHVFHLNLISSSVYFVNYLPSRLQWTDVVNIAVWAFGLSLVATIYPAWVASRTEPAEALRYE